MAPAGTVCPGSGTFTAPTYYGALPGESDDRSGGRTIIQMPSLLNTIPGWNGSVTGGSFTAYGDLGGTGTATQVLTQVASVDLRIVQVANGAIIFDQMMTPGQDTVGPFETATVNGLSPGRYLATFTLTDSHGDTSASQNPFVVEPSGIVAAQGTEGSQGPTAATGAITSAGPQGQAGPQGPQPQAGKSSSCTLTNRTVGTGRSKHKVQQIKCVLISSARGLIRVTISRGTATYATATAVVRPGMAQIRLRSLRPMKAGRYLVTIFTPGRKHATVTHFTMRI